MSTLALAAVSYDVVGAAVASGASERSIRKALADGDLIPHYLGTKPLIRAVDLDAWVQSLPTEKGGAR